MYLHILDIPIYNRSFSNYRNSIQICPLHSILYIHPHSRMFDLAFTKYIHY